MIAVATCGVCNGDWLGIVYNHRINTYVDILWAELLGKTLRERPQSKLARREDASDFVSTQRSRRTCEDQSSALALVVQPVATVCSAWSCHTQPRPNSLLILE